MRKTILFCHSVHHGNTKKLAEAAGLRLGATVVTLPAAKAPDLREYERIGFLSGIYMGDFGKDVYASRSAQS
jgi:flavodoxin